MTEKILSRSPKGFTLIELLIVVAIIAILAAIAVPNFLEAQVRAKASRAKADMRTIATGLEAYYTDNNAYPQCNTFATAVAFGPTQNPPDTSQNGNTPVLERLSTPIAYLSTVSFRDAFAVKKRKSGATSVAIVNAAETSLDPAGETAAKLNTYFYQAVNSSQRAQVATDSFAPVRVKATAWFSFSVGPDSTYHNLGGVFQNDATAADGPILLVYDPTNGTVSFGDIFREGGQADGSPTYRAGSGLREAIRIANGR